MTISAPPLPSPTERNPATRRRRGGAGLLAAGGLLLLVSGALASAAEAPYPFEGTWVRAERACTATTARARSYTAKDVLSPRGRCAIRRIAGGSGTFELLEDCGRNERPPTITETIRMTSPDSMTLRRQVTRLKIPRQIRYTRCTMAGPALAASQRAQKFGAPGEAKGRDHDPE